MFVYVYIRHVRVEFLICRFFRNFAPNVSRYAEPTPCFSQLQLFHLPLLLPGLTSPLRVRRVRDPEHHEHAKRG